ncbi:glycerol-3-phosphate O-acyltransferase [Auriscalpium vulgare]|uniref:Glycerol-3-phosphate O-acyltransferase n=1 Tax=Auriscalpium vulgare TaxID=40419 RepID=A0ACB8SCU6_9AGAM|nr:glycerol-3-phosphate O-acyltransferase [Auriscalpium vulgare]
MSTPLIAPIASNLSYDAALVFWRTVLNLFFREIRPRGAFNIPRDGPVIFVAAPHSNQFIDPLLLMLEVYRESRRRVANLAAAASMKRKAVGFFATMMQSIPVARAADDAKPGTGRVYVSPDDPLLVLGEDTKFTSEFTPKMQILLSKSVGSAIAEVTEIISDTQLRIKKEFGGDKGKGTARIREKIEELKQQGTIGIDYKRLPFVDQQVMYRHVYQKLKEGGCIGIFPEGGSHDRTDLLPLKAGVSIMALGAMANDPSVKVKIVPVGLSYFHAHKFRSRAVVEFGSALDVPAEFVDMFKEGGDRKKEAVSGLLNVIYDALKTVTVRAPDYDTLMLIQAARRLYKAPGQHLTLGQVVELNRRFLEGYEHFKDEPRLKKFRDDVLKYNRLVRDLGLRDHQVPRAQKASWKILGLLLYRVGLLSVWAVLTLPGVILNAPIFLIASTVSKKKAKEALAASVVKIAARDVVATWKILLSLGVAPILYGFYAFLAAVIAVKANAPMKWKIGFPALVYIVLPFMSYAALKFGEAGMDVLKSLRPLIVALAPGQQQYLNRLKLMREQLSTELGEVINEFGPQLYDDFDKWRMLVPSASVPPSTGTPGMWRRKSSAGAVDAQGHLLVHPMSWLDERLFGWSRSANRGTSAWAGSTDTRSQEISRAPTPEASDDEDTGDYDNVLGIVRGEDGHLTPSRGRSRSQHGSYADLQKLRTAGGQKGTSLSPKLGFQPLTPVHTTAVEVSDGTDAIRHRERRASLTDGVPVNRIAALDRDESFRDATQDINREIQATKHEPTTDGKEE